ncbi:MAG: DUF4465 domain-containing protein [Bacteroidales bacterium]|nr:DUF4465 domain-containing protein [Bacteroidales bacterium]
MKRFIFIVLVMASLASCLGDDPTVQKSYPLCADFELTDEYTHVKFFGSDSLYFDAQNGVGIGYDLLAFLHKLDEGKIRLEGGFLLSSYEYPEGGLADGLVNTWRTNAEIDKGQDRLSYLVFYDNPDETLMPEHDMHFTAIEYGTCSMVGCYVSNTVEVADSIAANFKLGDRLTLKATGWLNGEKTGEAEIYLADFSAQKDSIVNTWTPFELSKLGMVEYVDFELLSTNADVPGYVCIDYVCANISLEY